MVYWTDLDCSVQMNQEERRGRQGRNMCSKDTCQWSRAHPGREGELGEKRGGEREKR